MTPVHTPLLRRTVRTPGMGNLITKAAVTTITVGNSTVKTSRVMETVDMEGMDGGVGVEQIEEVELMPKDAPHLCRCFALVDIIEP